MQFYLAPMEGITNYIYRNAYHKYFHPLDKYFTPFLIPNQSKSFKTKELNDILPEHNQGLTIVPQILTNCAEDFLNTSQKLKAFGYNEINLNLGCPSGTVVAKYKGSGFLAKQNALNEFFEKVFSQADFKISVKTRIGKDDPDEFYELIEIYNRYPLEELIIHPRIQTDFYKNKPNLEVFKDAIQLSKNRICYNGDIHSISDYHSFHNTFPNIDTIMLGRGIIANPSLVDLISSHKKLELQRLREFHDQIYHDYQELLSGDRNVLFKMKELWFYMAGLFQDSSKYYKKIKKSEKLWQYEAIIEDIFHNRELL